MNHDFDALSLAARNAVNHTGKHELWKAALSLEEWFFIGTEHGEDAQPIVGIYEGRPHLLAFTDEDRATAFALARAAKKGGEPGPVLSMPPSDAVDYLVELREHVDGMVVNPGDNAFSSQPMALKDMRDRYNI